MSGTQPAAPGLAEVVKRSAAGIAIPAMMIATPAILFYGILFRQLVNLPFLDDYEAVLAFVNQLVQEKSGAAKFRFFLAQQHNEYKLFFVHGVAWIQDALIGHVNFAQLCVLGDSAVLAIGWILWSLFLPGRNDPGRRLAFFVPAAWLLFQLEYYETLNWAMASLQNLWVIAFSLGAICCLVRPERKAYGAALILYVLAIAASGNGFLLLAIGLLIFVTRRQMARAAGWLAISAVCIAAYSYHYDVHSSQMHEHGSVFAGLLHINPVYVIAFVGNAGAVAGTTAVSECICLPLGATLLLFFGWLARRGFFRRNAAAGYCCLFLLLTAAGVGGLRSEFGLAQSLESRYTIYGVLLVILAWTGIAEEWLWKRREPLLNNQVYLLFTVGAIVFALCMDEVGYLNRVRRTREAVQGMTVYEHPSFPGSTDGPMLDRGDGNPVVARLRPGARTILGESIRLGVYEPPQY